MSNGFAVSPDGRTIVAATGGKGLLVIRVDDGSSRSIATIPSAEVVQDVEFTSDGQGLVFTGMFFDSALYGIAHVDLTGKGEMLLSSSNAWLALPRVSPDGRWLAFARMAFDSDVWVIEGHAPGGDR
jgi:dipeptidyl aminopeptidase/acylaminoacyl peptidase